MDEKYFNNEYGKNIADKYLEFFLGGEFGTNPVALEIPIRPSLLSLKNLDDNKRAEILTILREHGLDAGDNPGQIMVSNDSIITPIIAPENIIPLYKTIEFLLRHYYSGPWFVFYPHIIDAKNIVPSQISGLSNTDWAERINYVDDMLHKISAQRDIFLSSDDEKRSQFAREVKSLINSGYFPPDVLFAGSTISDPYSVATGQSNRCLRYATSEPGYAIRYVWNDGKPNNFDLISKSGIKYGFVFLYKSREDFCQYWFNNGGIEEKKEGCLGALPNSNGADETMVNRFNNECIGEYLFFGVPFIHEYGHVYHKYGYVKINPNDEAWKKFKECAKTENARLYDKSVRFDAWAAGHNLEPVLPLLDKKKSISEIYESLQEIEHNKNLAEQNAVDKLNQQIKQISESFKKSFAELDETMNSFKEQEDNPDYDAQITYYDNALNTLKNIESIKNDLYQSLSEKISSLKSDIKIEKLIRWSDNRQQLLAAIDMIVLDLGRKKTNLDEKLKQQRYNLDVWRNHTEHNKDIYIRFFKENYNVFTDFDKQVMQHLDIESKKRILDNLIEDFKDKPMGEKKFLAELALFVYYCSTPQQRVELIDVLYKLRKTKKIAESRKILKESNAILVSYGFKPCPEIEELVKNDNIFVKHTKKAKEIVFKKATQKLQDDILRTQNVVHQTGSDERL